MARITIEDVRQELLKDNWKLISTEYKNLDTQLKVECSEGHMVWAPYKKLRVRRECPICMTNQFVNQKMEVIPKKAKEYRVLALDQATHVTGWSIYSDSQLLKFGSFEVNDYDDEIARDHELKLWLISMISSWDIDYVGLEGIQYQANQGMGVTVFETLARLQGILMEALHSIDIPYTICHTATWRNHCGVKGKARADRKKSMQLLVKQWFDVTVTDDCADAIGIGKYIVDKKVAKPKMESWD